MRFQVFLGPWRILYLWTHRDWHQLHLLILMVSKKMIFFHRINENKWSSKKTWTSPTATDPKNFLVLRSRPNLMVYVSYGFAYQTVLIGPLCMFNDYNHFITGENLEKFQVSLWSWPAISRFDISIENLKDPNEKKRIDPDNKVNLFWNVTLVVLKKHSFGFKIFPSRFFLRKRLERFVWLCSLQKSQLNFWQTQI